MLNKPCCVRDQYGNTERMDYNKNFLIYNDNVKEAVTRCLSIKLTNANRLYSNKYPDEETFAKALTVMRDIIFLTDQNIKVVSGPGVFTGLMKQLSHSMNFNLKVVCFEIY